MINGINQTFLSGAEIVDRYLGSALPAKDRDDAASVSFQDALKGVIQNSSDTIKFSKHASGRLADRNIELSKEQMERLMQGASKAGAKGIKDSLVMIDELAFIVNIPKNTVITAMDQSQADDKIFTNIDGAVIA